MMEKTPPDLILFVCEHGAAKSVIAAAYFNKLAGERNVNVRAIARGTNPDQKLSQKTIDGLARDGLKSDERKPQKLTDTDNESALQIISFCELPYEDQYKAPIEQWDDVPPVSENYEKARDTIIQRINQLLNTKFN